MPIAEIDDASEAERAERGHAQRHHAREVAQRVAAAIAIAVRVGQLAHADTVKDYEDDSAETYRGRRRQASCVE